MTTATQNRNALALSVRRILALLLRHLYLLRSSGPRILELMYWPTVQMILWGFITVFLVSHSTWVAQASGVLLSGVLLWDVLFRSQLGVSLVFMEEMWSRNLGHLFVSPLRPIELIWALLVMSLIRTLIGVGGAALIAIPLFDYSIFSLGLPLLAFFTNLIVMGWAIGLLVSGIVLRYGLGAESMAWVAIFAVQPVSGVYYPIEVLPKWLQYVAYALPSSHVFEGMRAVLFEHTFRMDLLVNALLLNGVYLAAGIGSFLAFFNGARTRGQLLHVGE
ncbi:MAG: ABC transporter [Candidatus Muproteobacteria bacterium RIFCSPHIGHO2_02_FULL_65_16]|uniref:Transport permease protein n=1 Tax=Candidatus Muproteobacteria bacterium RIFCSPHIGHO2_02_FULL_65_16 TaxID=1817766 RepID=A0A1F6U276_9PROT|nr:MAG: ABC transporter [Candidatus Muproteobacteria bacterium RIFCSPHIGHO2_02_FULL_65_16]